LTLYIVLYRAKTAKVPVLLYAFESRDKAEDYIRKACLIMPYTREELYINHVETWIEGDLNVEDSCMLGE